MNKLFYYDENTDEMKTLGEINDAEFLTLAEDFEREADARIYEKLPLLDSFSGEIQGAEISLEFRLLFKSWAGLVPRKIGVWA